VARRSSSIDYLGSKLKLAEKKREFGDDAESDFAKVVLGLMAAKFGFTVLSGRNPQWI